MDEPIPPDPLDQLFESFEHDGAPWLELHHNLLASSAMLPACSWRPYVRFPVQTPAGRKHAEQEISGSLIEGLHEAGQAVFHYSRENEWPSLSQPAIFVLIVAIDQIVDFVDLCSVPASNERTVSVFRYSGQPVGGFLLWFFQRWWVASGFVRWVRQSASDRKMFDSYFTEA